MTLATLTRYPNRLGRRNAAIFRCRTCEGWHLANGSKASPFQVHRVATASLVICDGCGAVRPFLLEGETVPVKIGHWPDLPAGIS